MGKRDKKAERAAREKEIGYSKAIARANTAISAFRAERTQRRHDAIHEAKGKLDDPAPEKATAARTSPLQEAILEAIALAPGPLWTGEIMSLVGWSRPSPSQRAAASRALERLYRRGLIAAGTPDKDHVGRGYLYGKAGASVFDLARES